MAKDLADFAETINKLRHEHDDPRINKKLASYEPGAKKSELFLVKMELKRLAQPVNRIIDLRPVLKFGCEPVIRGGITHYLDSVATDDFDDEYARYGNVYCMGVFDFVVERAKNRDQDELERSLVDKLPAPQLLSLSQIHQRRDERLYFASQVRLYQADPARMDGATRKKAGVAALTTDISENGLSLKVSATEFTAGEQFYLHFVELEQEYALPAPLFVGYKRLKHSMKQGFVYLILTLDQDQERQVLEDCRGLIKSCIHNYKRRNRVSVENTVAAVEAKIHEQFIVGKLNRLPVFMANNQGSWGPAAWLETPDNEGVRKFLQHPQHGSMLPALLSNQALQDALVETELVNQTWFVLRYKDKSKNLNFAAFPYSEVRLQPFLTYLVRKGLSQGGVKLLRVYACGIDPVSTCHIPSSLSDSVGEAFENLNRPPHQALLATVSTFQRMCVVSDITGSCSALGLDPSLPDAVPEPLNIRPYLLEPGPANLPFHTCRLEASDARQEHRFKLALPTKVRMKRGRDNQGFSAQSQSVSTRGLHLVTKNKHPFKKGEDVLVDMKLPFCDPEKVVTRQRYKVVEAGDSELRLAVTGDVANHEARRSLRRLIYANLDKVQELYSEDAVFGLSRAVRTLFVCNHINLCALTTRDGTDNRIRSIIQSDKSPALQLHADWDLAQTMDMLSKNLAFRKALFQRISGLGKALPATHFHAFVVARKKRKASPVVLVVKIIEDETGPEKLEFLYNNLKTFGEPRLLRIYLADKGPFFDKYVRDELRYLSRYAKLKHEESMAVVSLATGVVEFQDLTDLVWVQA